MGALRKIAVAVLGLSFIVFIALFGRIPTFRNTPIGFLHRAICVHLPNALKTIDDRLTGGRLATYLTRLGTYLFHEPHPLVLILFLGLITSCAVIFLPAVWPYLAGIHHAAIPLVLSLPYLFTYLTAFTSAPFITPDNHAEQCQLYPYDHTIYSPNVTCRTCMFLKPARSKHCSICRTCVGRADHHCVWVNKCIGRENYRWFILLLASLGVMLGYATLLAVLVLRPRVPYADTWNGSSGVAGLVQRWAAAFARNTRVGSVGLLAALTSPLAWGLFWYHVYLVWAGMTTNETDKWAVLKENMEDGLVWKGSRKVLLTHGSLPEAQPLRDRSGRLVKSRWPIESDQIIVTTRDGGVPILPGMGATKLPEGSWEKVWQLGQVVNLYDLGFWDNIRDAMNIL